MKRLIYSLLLSAAGLPSLFGQHTFSIVAVDTITGEVGSAGASCLDDVQFPGSGGAYIISDLLPGIGAIHTQAYWNATNQANARARMEDGLSPDEISAWLQANDAQGAANVGVRQYGIVALNPPGGAARAAAYTGQFCQIYRGHRTGLTYAIQGNILKGKFILDSMEARFLRAQGTLADRLMACLQGANVVGADTRCTANGTSSLSAFLRVAKPGDNENALYLDLNVPSLPAMTEPLDSLQTLYDNWKLTRTGDAAVKFEAKIYPNPAQRELVLQLDGGGGKVRFFDLAGRLAFEQEVVEGLNLLAPNIQPGVFIVQISSGQRTVLTRKVFWQ